MRVRGEEGGGVVSKPCGKGPLIGGTLPSINCCGGLRPSARSQERVLAC